VNERTWLTTTRPYQLISHVKAGASSRKLRLLAVACCYRIRELLTDPRWWRAVEAAEQYADEMIDAVTLDLAHSNAAAVVPHGNEGAAVLACSSVFHFDIHVVHDPAARKRMERKAQCELIRDIFGNPFRSVTFSPSWCTDTALSLARTMYGSRDFSAMPILADALQDAGCDNEDILNHCRDPKQVHVRGCCVVDLVLGKE